MQLNVTDVSIQPSLKGRIEQACNKVPYPISIIPFANMAPYRQLGPPEGCRWVELAPRASSSALLAGSVLAAAAPVGDIPELSEEVETLGRFGIAAGGEVGSVLLFSDVPVERLTGSVRLKLTGQSSSSVRLLYLLLGSTVGFGNLPEIAGEDEAADAELLIGDEALVQAGCRHGRIVTDLAGEWVRTRSLPFVFARWVIRKDAPDEARRAMLDWLGEFSKREEELLLASAPAEARRLGISTDVMLAYLRGMRRVLHTDDIRGQELFLGELRRAGACEWLQP